MEPQPDNAAAIRSWQLAVENYSWPVARHVSLGFSDGDKNMELKTLSLAYIFVLIRVNSWLNSNWAHPRFPPILRPS